MARRTKTDPALNNNQTFLQQLEFMLTMGGSLGIRKKKSKGKRRY